MPKTDIPEITPKKLKNLLDSGFELVILDVREDWEVALVHLEKECVVNIPMSKLSREGKAALPVPLQDPHTEIVVICHHGVRSAQVTGWLLQQGWRKITSLVGGVDAYARLVDPAIGRY
jgi:rhodanese-related sulfurtransferase